MAVKINNSALERSPVSFSKEPLEKGVKRIIEKNGVDGKILAEHLDNILNNSLNRKSILDEAEKIKDNKERNAVNDCINLAEEYEGILPISLGEIIAKISKLIKEFTDSIINFSQMWNDAMDSNLKIGISAAQNQAMSGQWSAVGELAGGIIGIGAGGLTMAGGFYEGVLSQQEKQALDGIIFGIPEGTDESGSVAASEVSQAAENEVGSTTAVQAQEEIELREIDQQQAAQAEKAKIGSKNKENKRVALTEEDKKLEREKIVNEFRAKKMPVEKFVQAMNIIGTIGGGIPKGIGGLLAAEKGAEAEVARAYSDYVSTRKAQNQQLFDNTSRQTTSIADLSQSINAYIRACIPA
ncbi:MAG: hypothetical protein AMS24_00330 [Chlamydiae bacterium SM23_39]|nr:MAG: hypothetical protein AMS24_00330 [Chlamydiae bacterium SM23_39]